MGSASATRECVATETRTGLVIFNLQLEQFNDRVGGGGVTFLGLGDVPHASPPGNDNLYLPPCCLYHQVGIFTYGGGSVTNPEGDDIIAVTS